MLHRFAVGKKNRVYTKKKIKHRSQGKTKKGKFKKRKGLFIKKEERKKKQTKKEQTKKQTKKEQTKKEQRRKNKRRKNKRRKNNEERRKKKEKNPIQINNMNRLEKRQTYTTVDSVYIPPPPKPVENLYASLDKKDDDTIDTLYILPKSIVLKTSFNPTSIQQPIPNQQLFTNF
jgi:hypothetical protein